MNGPNKHRLLGALADGAGYFTNAYLRQEGRLFVQIISHRGEAWGDNAAGVIPRTIDDVESYRGSEIYDHGRGTELVMHRDCIGKAIGTDGCRLVIIDADTAQRFVGQHQTS